MSNLKSELGKSSTRTIRRVEAPRPLKKAVSDTISCFNSVPLPLLSFSIESVDKLVILMDMIVEAILQNDDSPNNVSGDAASVLTNNVVHLYKHLKIFGPQVENKYRGQLDRMCSVFQNVIVRDSLEHTTLVNMMDVLDLRESSWKIPISPEKTNNNKNGILSNLKTYVKSHSTSCIDHEESRKSPKSSKYVKDEVVIRNSDSGKVMGIKGRRVHMIEQLSDTIISFQRVTPTAKERLVQINGANEENVASAVRLIRETIRNNASPVRDLRSESDSTNVSSVESFFEHSGSDEPDSRESELSSIPDTRKSSSVINNKRLFKHIVSLSNCELTITGDDYNYVTVAKTILDGYFSNLRKSTSSVELKNEKIDCGDDTVMLNSGKSWMGPLPKATVPKPSNTFETYESRIATSLSDDYLSSKNPSSPSEYTDVSDVLHSDKISLNASIDDNISSPTNSPSATPTNEVTITYTKEFMFLCRTSDLSQDKPKDWDLISSKFPALVKTSDDSIDIFEFEKSDE